MASHSKRDASPESSFRSGLSPGNILEHLPDGRRIPDETWARRHRYFILLILAHVPVLLAIGLFQGTESVTGATLPELSTIDLLTRLGPIVVFAAGAAVPRFSRRVRTFLSATALVACSAVLVQFSGGYIEAHFHFFVVVGLVTLYEDWLPFGVSIVYVVLTHGVFGMIEPSTVYNHAAAQIHPWIWGLIHGVFVAFLSIALTIHLASIERSRASAQERLENLEERANEIEDLERRQSEIEAEKAEAQQLKAEAEEEREAAEALNAHLEQKAKDYQRAMERAAGGDLTVRVDTESESEAMTAIGTSFNEMLDDIEETVGEIQAFAGDVQERTGEVDSSTREAASVSEDLSESVQTIAAGTDEQREMLDEVNAEMSDFSATIEEVAASAQEVTQVSDETTALAADGQELADEMIADAERVQQSISEAVETADDLAEEMETIAEITDLISDIADQTNMLALNASIEAARAGGGGGADGGDGFDVVASEVKQLAEETQASAGDIRTQIETTREKTETVVAAVSEAQDLMEKEVEVANRVAEAFEQVADNAVRTDDGIQEISDTTDDQAASSEEVVSMVDEVSEISDRSADEAQSVSAAVQQQTASINEVSENASAIAARAGELTDLLSTFTVGDDTRRALDSSASAAAPGADQ